MKNRREERMRNYYEEEKMRLFPFSFRELLIAGMFLYWGEGNKSTRHAISLANTDPFVVKFFHYWLVNILGVGKQKIKVNLQLYSDMSIENETVFWSKQLGIKKDHFNKPYIKTSKKTSVDHKGFGHGTCTLTIVKDRLLMGIKAIGDNFN